MGVGSAGGPERGLTAGQLEEGEEEAAHSVRGQVCPEECPHRRLLATLAFALLESALDRCPRPRVLLQLERQNSQDCSRVRQFA